MPWSPTVPCPRCRALHGCGCRAAAERARGSSSARGYGRAHQAVREAVREDVEAGTTDCARCGLRILPGEAWDLGHTDDRTGWTGPEHARCNRAAPRLAGHLARNGSSPSAADRGAGFREIKTAQTASFPGRAP